MKKQTIAFGYNNINYEVSFSARQVTVMPGTSYRWKDLTKGGHFYERSYQVPFPNGNLVVYMDMMGKRSLSLNGIDPVTGLKREPMKLPEWSWAFFVLYIINFFVLIGGALGAIMNIGFASATINVASDSTKKTSTRVLQCIAIYAAVTILEAALAFIIISFRN